MMDHKFTRLDIRPVNELIQLVIDASGCVYGCKMSVDKIKLSKDDLVAGAGTLRAMEFLEVAAGFLALFA